MAEVKITVELDPEDRERIDGLVKAVGDIAKSAGVPASDDGGKEEPKKSSKSKPKAEEKEAEPEVEKEAEPEGPTRDDVRKALKDYASLESKEAAISILKEHGEAASLSDLKEDKFQAVLDALD